MAWGEGWANFLQAAITGSAIYLDTSGTTAGTPGIIFNENIESGSMDTPVSAGEGNFREFSVTRALWDMIDTNNEGAGVDQVTASFAEFWTILSSNTTGFANSSRVFRSIGLFHELQGALGGGSDLSSIRTGEKHTSTQANYADSTIPGGCGATAIQAANIPGGSPEDGTAANSNQLNSNDFYKVAHAGGAFNLSLSYTTTGGNSADLDLIVYRENYVFGSTSTQVGSGKTRIPIGDNSGGEAVNLSNLGAGNYMINVHVFTGNRLGASANYTLTLNGQAVCP